jgi:hypothetical protein
LELEWFGITREAIIDYWKEGNFICLRLNMGQYNSYVREPFHRLPEDPMELMLFAKEYALDGEVIAIARGQTYILEKAMPF